MDATWQETAAGQRPIVLMVLVWLSRATSKEKLAAAPAAAKHYSEQAVEQPITDSVSNARLLYGANETVQTESLIVNR